MTRHNLARARGGVLATAPWRRAPRLLFTRPAVLLAIVAAVGILSIAAASGPLFLSTIGTAELSSRAAQTCPEAAQPTITAHVRGTRVEAVARTEMAAMTRAGLPDTYVATESYATVQHSLVHFFSRAGALGHVRRLTPDTGRPGVWVPDNFAAALRLRPGDSITTTSGARARVAGLYRALAPNPFALSHLARYWCSYTDRIVSTVASDASIAGTPPFDRQGAWLIGAAPVVARAAQGGVRVTVSSPLTAPAQPLSRFELAAGQARAAAASASATGPVPVRVDPGLTGLVRAAIAARDGVSGSIVPIEAAGAVVAALLVGGAGLFWAAARRREVRLLVSRGVGPLPLAAKAVLETALPALVGAALGLGATFALVRAVGPAPTLEPGAFGTAAALVAAALAAGLALIGGIAAASARERTTGRRASRWRHVPWELALLGPAVGLLVRRHDTPAVSVDHTVVRIDASVVLLPLLAASAALILLGRLVGLLLPAAGHLAGRLRVTPYLTLRRLARSRAIAIGLLVGTALPCALLMYGSTVTDTVRGEVTAKYQSNLGAPRVLQIYGVHGALFDTRGTGTQVVEYVDEARLGGVPVEILGVDPATFARFAFADADQRAALTLLPHPGARGRIPAIIVNSGGRVSGDGLVIGSTHLDLDPVASDVAFPGLRNSFYPLVVVDQRALGHVDESQERLNQLWTDDASYAAARRLLARRGYSVLFQLTSQVLIGSTGLLPVTWLFGYLRALAVLIGVVAFTGLVFGLAARTRRRKVSYVLSRRMGMSRTAHLGSLVLELAIVVGLGWLAGSVFGLGSFRAVYRRFDVYPDLKPPPVFTVPTGPLVVTALVVAGVVVLSALATQLLAERTRPAEILRLE